MKARPATLIALVAGCLAAAGGSARAACTISVTGVVFGSYDVFSPAPLDSTGSVAYICDKPDRGIRITLSTGSSGTYLARTLVSGPERLRYNLYINGLTAVWGDGSGGTDVYTRNNPPDKKPMTIVIYGRIPPLQDVGAGAYADTIQAQVDF